MFSDPYLRQVARTYGIPPMWDEDYMQEARLALWKAEQRGWKASPVTVVRSAAIDFSRKYGIHTRYGRLRPVAYLTDELAAYLGYDQDFGTVEEGPCVAALRSLDKEDQELIIHYDILGEPLIRRAGPRRSGSMLSHLHSRALKRLREKVMEAA